ncbi:glycosyltransferase family 39 protein [Curtobacterium sp. RHCJP20]|uniref:Glycosyltransferase family 39 protein n=1 Tax=Curtobacterium subtropicum TaxID=3055138 RepID=A0ABT7TI28_9MICO|nr:glycosyltransferase family 39 protein [Curtobacterium subtropicum]MDM7889236.1 glycosyltransferase family 39 protein [Curtobacterium subtropicum]
MAVLGPVLVGLAAFLVAVIGSWVPSVWYDEAATVTSAARSWTALGREVQQVDLVHATYYALMHVWFGLVGYTPFTLRLPSAIAVGVTAAVVVILGRRLAGARLGIIAGLLFAVLPRVTWMGAEGRSFALGALLATLSTLLLLAAVDRTAAKRAGWIWWVVYGAVSLLGCAVFLYLILVPIGHFLTLLALRRIRHETSPIPLAAWIITTAVVLIGAVPLAVLSSAQSAQISWIQHISAHTVEEFLVTQFSYENTGFAVLLWVLAGFGFAAAVKVERLRPVLAVAVPWVFVPTLALIAASIVTHPLYSPRYIAFAAPAAALLMAAPLAAVPTRWFRPAAIVVLLLAVGLSAPSWAAQRTVTAKDGSAWNQVAALIQRQRLGESDSARDAVLFGPVQRHPKATSRIIAESYPAAFAGLDDPLLITPAGAGDGLWETQQPLRYAGRAVGGATTVWLVTATKPDDRATATAALRPAGFHQTQQWKVARTWVVRYDRG